VFLGALKAVAILPSITNNNLTMSNMLGDALREYTGLRHQIDENLIGENGLLKQLRKSCKTPRSVWYLSACNGILTGHEAKQP
jgi:hypothetical protein